MIKMVKTVLALSVVAVVSLGATEIDEDQLLGYVTEKEASGDVAKVYGEIKAAWGFVPVVMKQYSLHPELLRLQWELYKAMGANKNFSDKMLTMMRLLVADDGSCEYCIGFNEGMLINLFKVPLEEVQALKKDATSAKLDAKQKAMLLFILQSVKNPHANSKADIKSLHALGWSDKDIFDGVKMGAGMVAGSIMIDALKLQADY